MSYVNLMNGVINVGFASGVNSAVGFNDGFKFITIFPKYGKKPFSLLKINDDWTVMFFLKYVQRLLKWNWRPDIDISRSGARNGPREPQT
ncbi:hypothetical protein C4J81_09265 [Deltaproteobacteria bacterium Smac51]|nr:hypothetical protein C4J81_09265 [Deltaproteobacteria bacterium Smac51]